VHQRREARSSFVLVGLDDRMTKFIRRSHQEFPQRAITFSKRGVER